MLEKTKKTFDNSTKLKAETLQSSKWKQVKVTNEVQFIAGSNYMVQLIFKEPPTSTWLWADSWCPFAAFFDCLCDCADCLLIGCS